MGRALPPQWLNDFFEGKPRVAPEKKANGLLLNRECVVGKSGDGFTLLRNATTVCSDLSKMCFGMTFPLLAPSNIPQAKGQRSRPFRKVAILGPWPQGPKNWRSRMDRMLISVRKYVIVGIAYHMFGMLIWLGCWWRVVLLADAAESKVSWRDLFRTVDQFGSWMEICRLIQWARLQGGWSFIFRRFSVGFSWARMTNNVRCKEQQQ